MNHPTGKGIFIWNLDRCAGGDPVRLAAEAVMQGFSYVVIKVVEAKWRFKAALISAAIRELRAQGIKVWGYGFVYLGRIPYPTNTPQAEAQAGIDAVRDLGLDGYVIDAEGHAKAAGAGPTRIYMTALRAGIPTTPIGLCSYRFPTVQPELAWPEFLRGCDFHMPQVYFQDANYPGEPIDADAQLARSVRELTRLRDIPVVPVGPAYREHGLEPTVAEMDGFDAKAKELRLPGICWWSFEHAERRVEWWRAIAAHTWGPPGPIPLTLEEKIDLLWQSHPEVWP